MAPLTNVRILITRTRHQASALASGLQTLGADTILIPTIELAPPTDLHSLLSSLAELSSFDWIIFTSANAVEAFARYRGPAHSHSSPHPKIAAIGPATAAALEKIGAPADLIPPMYVAESLAAALLPHLTPGHPTRILLVRAEHARDTLPEILTAAGATLVIAPAYRTITPPGTTESLQSLFAGPTHYPHAITFTSSSTAINLFHLLDAAGITLPPQVALASIGPITTQTLRDLNHPPHLEAAEPTIPSLIAALANFYALPTTPRTLP